MFDIITFFTLLCLVNAQAPGTWSPGCSFHDGQCAYQVSLGHAGKCDQAASTTCCQKLEADNLQTKTDFLAQLVGMKDQIIGTVKQQNSTDARLSGHNAAIADTFSRLQQQISLSQTLEVRLTAMENKLTRVEGENNKLNKQVADVMQILKQTTGKLDGSKTELSNISKERDDLLKELGIKESIYNQTTEKLQTIINTLNDLLRKANQNLTRITSDLNTCNAAIGSTSSSVNCNGTPPPLHTDYAVLRCDFDDGGCQLTQDTDDDINWTFRNGKFRDSGPDNDHTYGTRKGKYMLIDPQTGITSRRSTRSARVSTPVLSPGRYGYCVQFYYYMLGAPQPTLNVYAKVGKGRGYPIWSLTGDQGGRWNLATINITPEYTSQDFQVVLEGHVSSYYYSPGGRFSYYNMNYPAIDDLTISNRPCTAVTSCPKDSYRLNITSSSHCYWFVPVPLSWYEAVDYCKNFSSNAHLISVTSQEVQGFVLQTVRANKALSSASALGWYTCGNDAVAEGSFVWTRDNVKLASQGYTNWIPGQPNNVGDNQHCLLLEGQPDMTWGDVDCATKHPFICESVE